MRHETRVPPAEPVSFTLDHYESSAARRMKFSAVVLGVGFALFAAGYLARAFEERFGHEHGAKIQRERVAPEWRAP